MIYMSSAPVQPNHPVSTQPTVMGWLFLLSCAVALIVVEHYKYLLNQIAQLGIDVDQKAFLEKAQSEDRLTVSELEMWKRIHEHRWGFET
jgi:hypothetical protein